MYIEQPRARIGYQTSAVTRAKHLAVKALVLLGGALMLASAFVVSVVFLAVGLAVVLIGGGYLWWKTRDLRRQLRARMHERSQPAGEIIEGDVIEGEVIEGDVVSRDRIRR
jgi:hypothetical protein